MACAAPVILYPVPVAAVTGPEDYFRCEPYAATIRATVCLQRQLLHGSKVAIRAGWGMPSPQRCAQSSPAGHRYVDYGFCADCRLGHQIADQLGW